MGAGEVLRDCEGARLVPDDVEAFANTVVGLLQDREGRAELAQRARSHARQWGSDVFAARLVDYYETLIGVRADMSRSGHKRAKTASHPQRGAGSPKFGG
jgi:hypothetical protein